MKKLAPLFLAFICLFFAACGQEESNSPEIKHPRVREYTPGQGNAKGNVPAEEYAAISRDFAVGADREGHAVFKDPEKALSTLCELYPEGIALIRQTYDL